MMKKFSFWFTGMCLLVACLGITSCAEDDGEDGIVVTLQDPPFEGISALYEVEFGTSDIKSVELTESGQYIITKNSASTYKVIRKKGILRSNPQVRAIEKDNLITGVYTKVSHTEYALEGYGTLKVNVFADDGKFETITLLPDDGGEIAMDVVAKAPVSNSNMTANLCRTWIPESLEEKEWENGVLVWHAVYDYATKQVSVKVGIDGDRIEEDWLEKVIFSKAGTYICFYDDDTFEKNYWRWEDEATGLLSYWYYDVVSGMPDSTPEVVPTPMEKNSGEEDFDVVYISFYDNKMEGVEHWKDSWDDVVYEGSYAYVLRSAN
jgi:hypothetical protein